MSTTLITIVLSGLAAGAVYFGSKELVKHPRTRQYIIDHWWLHPNAISAFRVPAALFALVLYHFWYTMTWTVLYVIVAVLDATDGIFARGCNLVSERGKSLDPLADKVTYFMPLLYFWYLGDMSVLLVWVFIIIDTLGQFSRVILKKFNLQTQANIYGKLKTTLVFVFIFTLMLVHPNVNVELNNWIMWVIILFAILSIVFKVIPSSNNKKKQNT